MSALPAAAYDDAALAACMLAVDPASLGGLVVRSPASEGRDRFVSAFRAMLRPDMPVRKIPPSIDDDRLLGGLDLAATLRAGRPDRSVAARSSPPSSRSSSIEGGIFRTDIFGRNIARIAATK